MTGQDVDPIEPVETAARDLAECHCLAQAQPRAVAVWSRLERVGAWLPDVLAAARDAEPAKMPAAEWLLDNDYHVRRAILQIREDLPASFYRQLPSLASAEADGFPRIFTLAHGVLSASHLQLSPTTLLQFVLAYQETAPLTMAEIWAFPTMLRLACLEVLVTGVSRIFDALEAPFEVSSLASASSSLDDTECVSRALANLAVIETIQWKDFFDRTSVIEEILARDPAGIYSRMDFDTRDDYRHTIERLANRSRQAEWEIAERLLMQCRLQSPERARDHVGFWLIGEGRAQFEDMLEVRPSGFEALGRKLLRHPTAIYASSALTAGLAGLIVPALYLAYTGATLLFWIIGIVLSALPASILSITVVNWIVTLLVPPRKLPKLDFEDAISPDCATAVVMPVLVASVKEVQELIERIESHRLANPDPLLQFVLLSDLADADVAELPGDIAVERALVDGIEALNRRYRARDGDGPFRLMHRRRLHNPAQGCWMAWERKRGKIEQFNAFVLHGDLSPFPVRAGNIDALRQVRFVAPMDADTRLPPRAVHRLVGTLAHPLNHACFDDTTNRVISGYTILQPRVEIAPVAAGDSKFTQIFAGDTAIDIYSRAVSDVYHDLLGVGIFVGKGLYEVAPFERSLKGLVQENSILSHDLIEGLHGRVGLTSDIIVYETFPSSYLDWVRRWHRWIRGDWQLLPWLGRKVRGREGKRIANGLSGIDRLKIFDNLRRSLIAPGTLALLIAGWFWLPGRPWAWTLLAVAAPGAYVLTDFVTGLVRHGLTRGSLQRLTANSKRWALVLVLLVSDSVVAASAVLLSLWRLASRRHLLEWTSAAHVSASLADQNPRRAAWRQMWGSPLVAALAAAGLVFFNPAALIPAAPLLLVWLFAPEIVLWTGRPIRPAVEEIDLEGSVFLRRLARRTWLFFETFVRPEDNWLPPDNYQERPDEDTAHRTSPTNIGMMLLSSLTAWKLGHIGLNELAARTRNTLATLDRLETYRGHILNWYETRHLEPLEPRYVSTVDSGNLAASLIVVSQGCREAVSSPALSANIWDGLGDTLDLLNEALDAAAIEFGDEARMTLARMRDDTSAARSCRNSWNESIEDLSTRAYPLLETHVRDAINRSNGVEPSLLRGVQSWLERTRHHLDNMQRSVTEFSPWQDFLNRAPSQYAAWAAQMRDALTAECSLLEIEADCQQARDSLSQLASGSEAADWISGLDEALDRTIKAHRRLREELENIAKRAAAWAYGMDFRFLFDGGARLFHIGYNVSADRIDPNHYDLMASEARIASFFAISKGDVPVEHWFFLGRPITKQALGLSLVSWSGSMFEYLMPNIFLRSDPATLLGQSDRSAVDFQRAYAKTHNVPWGISESGFASMDPERHYRYQAFGVPGLGLRRGLTNDLVIAPYATTLALSVRSHAALDNLRTLVGLGLLGRYGFYEAADFTPERVPTGRHFNIVRSYMAHHQGMSLAAIGNALFSDIFVDWFHAEPSVRTFDLLLNERVPWELPPAISREEVPESRSGRETAIPALHSWAPRRSDGLAQWHTLGNGRLNSRITANGAGSLWWHDYALTRWKPGYGSDQAGLWLYLRDEDEDHLWSVTGTPVDTHDDVRVVFHGHQAEFHSRQHDVAVGMTVGVPPGDDLEIRRITITNESDRRRVLELTSYAEVMLAPPRDSERHPAFSKLFIGSEALPGLKSLLFTRRPRNPDERPPVLLHRLVADDPKVAVKAFETDRRRFLGRNGRAANPAAITSAGLSGTAGWTLDPVMSIQARITLEPFERCELAFVTIIAGSRETALQVSERYATVDALDWAMNDAAREMALKASRASLGPDQLPDAQALLSAVLQPHPALRALPAAVALNRFGQAGLWALGISGDHPILAVRVGDAQITDALRSVLAAWLFWSRQGVTIDLVVLHIGISGYIEPVRDRLIEVLRDGNAHELLGRDGGVHLVAVDPAQADRAALVEAAAHVLLDEAAGSVRDQLATLYVARIESPKFEPGGRANFDESPKSEGVRRPNTLQFDNGLGGFSADGTEYIIHLEAGETTPAPWANVLANDEFGSIVTEAGLGFSWAINSGENRLTPWSNDPVADPQTEILYLRDEESARVWTPTPQPAGADETCQIRHGAGYTIWTQNRDGLEQELLAFVPSDDPVKIVRLRLHNSLPRPRRITATYYAEWLLGSMEAQPNSLLVTDYDAAVHAIMATNRWNSEFGERMAFLTSSRPPHSLTTSRSDFFGDKGDLDCPEALRRWDLGGRQQSATDSCGALQVHLDLTPGETADAVFVLGQGSNRAHAQKLARRWQDEGEVERALEARKRGWNEQLGAVEVSTPDAAFDLMINRWLPYQTVSSRLLARAGFYQAGGAFGFRDQLQDVLALVHSDPARIRSHILTAAAHQFEEGDVLHWWHPPFDRGVRTRCSDDLLWLPYATSSYVAATSDETILSEDVPFLQAPALAPEEKDRYARFGQTNYGRTLFEHCERALERGFIRGERGLPLIGSGDWNDGMDRVGEHGRGESIWLAWFTIATIDGFVGLCKRVGRTDLVERWVERGAALKRAVEDSGWDGNWYLRAIDDEGRPWGSASNDECQIDSIAQSWAVLSGAGDPERSRSAMMAAMRHLVRDDDQLVRLLSPPFDLTPRDPGYIKAYPPGIRENGGQYTHAAAWLGIAQTKLRNGDGAIEIFNRINPINHTYSSDACIRYLTEPYALAGDVAGSAPHTGRGGWSWYTGAAAWTWRLGVEHILGLRLVEGRLVIDPCLPKSWKSFSATISRPTGSLNITVEDPEGLGTGKVSIEMDGEQLTVESVAFPDDGSIHEVIVRIWPIPHQTNRPDRYARTDITDEIR